MTGKLITFEGPEGGGKSTHAAALAQKLEAAGHKALLTREPGGTWLGEGIRDLLKTSRQPPPAPTSELLLFLAARAQLTAEIIQPALAAGMHVVCDRYADSTTVYQGYARGMDLALVRTLNSLATGGLMPDATLLLDLNPAAGLRRVHRRQAEAGAVADRIELEAPEFHENVRRGYLELARLEPGRFHRLDAERPLEELQACIWDVARHVVES